MRGPTAAGVVKPPRKSQSINHLVSLMVCNPCCSLCRSSRLHTMCQSAANLRRIETSQQGLVLSTVGALILQQKSILKSNNSNRASRAGDPVSIVASRTFLVASRKAVAKHPFAVERSTVLCSSCPYHHVFTTSAVLGTLPKLAL